MSKLTQGMFEWLISPGPRVKMLEKWLLEEVWTQDRYEKLSAVDYLKNSEGKVNDIEEVIASAAFRLYDEFLGEPPDVRDVLNFIQSEEPSAIIIFDGLSLRELPVLLNLAAKSELKVSEAGVTFATLPTETLDYIKNRLKIGPVTPSQLPGRKELTSSGISTFYYSSPSQQHILDHDVKTLLLWSAFPDNTYSDSGARFAQHFEQIHTLLETAWSNTVMQIPRDRKILITSDHGYVYFGSGLSFGRNNSELRPLAQYLGGERYRRLTEEGEPPLEHPDLAVFPSRQVAAIRGRVQTHPPGKSATRLYKHGGLSIMEMLIPWLVLNN